MSTTIDQRIVEMRFDNAQFEHNIAQSTESLEKLKDALDLDASVRNFDELEEAAGNLNLSGITTFAQSAKSEFNALYSVLDGVFKKIGIDIGGAISNVSRELASFSLFGQLGKGFEKYSQITQSTQTIVAAGYAVEQVEEQMRRLNWYTDETSYSLEDMTDNISKFTAQRIPLEEAATAMMGISNWAAAAGQEKTAASRVMYNLSQALGAGYVKLIDWKSVENANMATAQFKQVALDAAVAAGTLIKAEDKYYTNTKKKSESVEVSIENFSQTLAKGWFDKKTIMGALNEYGKAIEKVQAIVDRSGDEVSTYQVLTAIQQYKDGVKAADGVTDAWKETLADSRMSVDSLEKALAELSGEEYDLSLKSLIMAQEAITLRQSLDYVKDAASTSWANIWQSIFGNYEDSKNVWSQFAEDLDALFVEPVRKLQSTIGGAFKGSFEQVADYIADSGVSTDIFKSKLIELGLASGAITEDMVSDGKLVGTTWEELFQNGTLDGGIIRQALKELSEGMATAGSSAANSAEKLKEYQDLVSKIIRGDFGNGAARKNALTELGYDYDLVQGVLVNKVINGGTIALEDLSEAELKAIGITEEEIEVLKQLSAEAEESGTSLDVLLNRMNRRSGRELFAESIHNTMAGIAELSDLVRGTFADAFGIDASDAIYNFLLLLNRATTGFYEFATTNETLRTILQAVASVAKVLYNAFSLLWAGVKPWITFLWNTLGVGLNILGKFISAALNPANRAMQKITPWFSKAANGVSKFVGSIEQSTIIQSIIGAVSTVFEKLFGAISSFAGYIEAHFPGLKGLFTTVWTSIKNFVTQLIESERAQKVFQALKDVAELVGEKLKTAFEGLGESFGNFIDQFSTESGTAEEKFASFKQTIEGIVQNLKDLFTPEGKDTFDILNLFPNLKAGGIKSFREVFSGIFSNTAEEGEQLLQVTDSIGNSFRSLGAVAKDPASTFNKIRESLMKLATPFEDLPEKIQNLDYDKLTGFLAGGAILGNATRLTKGFDSFIKVMDNFSTAFKGFGETVTKAIPNINPAITSFSKALDQLPGLVDKHSKRMTFKSVATGILMIAVSIALLVGAIWVLSKNMDSKAMWEAVKIIAVLMAIIGAFTAVVAFAIKRSEFKPQDILTLLAIPLALMLFAGAMLLLSKIKWGSLAGLAIAIGTTILALSAITNSVGKVSIKQLIGILIIPGVLLLFAAAFWVLSKVDWSRFGGIIIGIGLAILSIAGLTNTMGHVSWKSLLSLVAIPIALMLFARAFEVLARVDWSRFPTVALSLGMTLLTMVAMMAIIDKSSGELARAGIGIMFMSAALILIGKAFDIFMKIPYEDKDKFNAIVRTVLGILFMFSLITAASKFSGKEAMKAGGAIMMMGVALVLMAGAMVVMSLIPIEKMGPVFAAVILILGMFALIVAATKNAKDAYKTVFTIAIVLGLLVGALALLAMIDDMASLGRAAGSLGLVMLMLGVLLDAVSHMKAGGALTVLSVVPVILAVAGALFILADFPAGQLLGAAAAIAVSVIGIAAALAILGKVPVDFMAVGAMVVTLLSFGATALMVAASVYILALAIEKFIQAINSVENVSRSGGGFNSLGNSVSQVLTGIAASLPALAESIVGAIVKVIVGIVGVVYKYSKMIVGAVVFIITDLLIAIRTVLPTLLTLVVDTIVTVCNAIDQSVDTVLTTITNLILSILTSIANNMFAFVEKGAEIILAFIDGIRSKIGDIIQAAFDFVVTFINALAEAIRGNTEPLKAAFWNLITAMLESIVSMWETIKEKGREIIDKVKEGITEKIEEIKTKGEDIVDKLKEGIFSIDFSSIGTNIIDAIIGALGDTAIGRLFSKGVELGKALLGGAQSAKGLDINSPSKKFIEVGKNVNEGLVEGVQQFSYKVSRSGVELASGLYNSVANGLTAMQDIVNGDYIPMGITPVINGSQIQNGLSGASITARPNGLLSGLGSSITPSSSSSVTTNSPIFNIYQQPGEDPEALARIINRELGRMYVR